MANFFPLSTADRVRITDGTDTALIDTNGNLQVSNPELALSSASNSTSATNNTQTLYTVPANKKAYILALQLSANMGSVASSDTALLKLNGNTALVCFINSTTTAFNTSNTSLNFPFKTCPILTAGQTVTLTTTNTNCNAKAVVHYYEVSV